MWIQKRGELDAPSDQRSAKIVAYNPGSQSTNYVISHSKDDRIHREHLHGHVLHFWLVTGDNLPQEYCQYWEAPNKEI